MRKKVAINKLIRENILNLVPYSSARTEFTGTKGTFLNANENSLGTPGDVLLNRYPDPVQYELKQKIAKQAGCDFSQIFLGNGSSEIIDYLIRISCYKEKDSILINNPTFGLYEVFAQINEIEVIDIPLLESFLPDEHSVLNAIKRRKPKIVFLCSPNNPTGIVLPVEFIKKVLTTSNGMVVIDEAYGDFSNKDTWIKQLNNYQNLVILQTFSKAWGMADIRLGILYGDPQIVKALNKIKPPSNISGLTQRAALHGLENLKFKQDMAKTIIEERKKIAAELGSLHCVRKIFPSQANFILVKVDDASSAYRHLLKHNIIVRDKSNEHGCADCLRITIGAPEENRKLVEVMRAFDESFCPRERSQEK